MSLDTVHHAVAAAKHTIVEPTVSAVLPEGTLVELLYRPHEDRTLFAVAKDDTITIEESVLVGDRRLVPFSPSNNLLKHEVVMFPSEATDYGSEEQLVSEIQAFIHRFVDVSPLYERISAYYVLFTWVHDAFNELAYLRLLGDPGSGKTRFLLTVGALCYKPIFASGASTVSPLFRILDAIKGTLVIDEGDFRLSDERAEIVKILNNGNGRGFPVLRSELTPQKEYSPTAYHVFGPKIVATRSLFEDRALESRCLTEELGLRKLRADIPINLPESYKIEALALRNKLLTFRFKTLAREHRVEGLADPAIEPRLNQVIAPLLAIVGDDTTRAELRNLARRFNAELVAERGQGIEAHVLEVIRDLRAVDQPLTIKAIADWFADRHADEYDRKVTPKWIGTVIRNRLHLRTERQRDGFVLAAGNDLVLGHLFERYGVTAIVADNDQTAGVNPERPQTSRTS